ncbi:MAG: tetratricopeptide repeat protein [Gemmataceae bacterium]|nr:tetratricopeptide repeat protein [Gemmataceae bacterium]
MTRRSSSWWFRVPGWAVGLGLAILAAGLLVFALSIRRHESAQPADDPTDDGRLVVVRENPGYVGPQVCAECHSARVHEFQATRHFKAAWRPEDGPMPSAFDEGGTYVSRNPGVRFTIEKRGDEYIQTLIRNGPTGERRDSWRIDLIYGSGGRADEVYFTWKGNTLHELPIAWLGPQQCWGEQFYDPLDPGDFTRVTTVRCVECHFTWIGHVAGTENEYRRDDAIWGVTCERCHGPGRDHVEYHRRHPDDRRPQAIARPRQLSREQQMDLCGQCHSNALRGKGPPFRYRPGEPLEDFYRLNLGDDRESDHVADQVKYLKRSRCFQQSDMTCTTCHNPHRPQDAASVARSCQKCHEPESCGDRTNLPLGVRDDCVSCHMPEYNRVAIKFHTAEDQYVFPMRPHEHRIGIYPAARLEALWKYHRGRPEPPHQSEAERIRQLLAEHWRAEGRRLQSEHRLMSAIGAWREAWRFDPTPETRRKLDEAIAAQAQVDADLNAVQHALRIGRPREAIPLLERILTIKPNLARAHGRLGTLYASVGQMSRAVEHLETVTKHDPDDAYGLNMLGWMAYVRGDGVAALEFFRRADAIMPYTVEINHRWGLALLSLERWSEAKDRFQYALDIDPNHAGSLHGLSLAWRQLGEPEKAVESAERAARLTRREEAEVLWGLAEAYFVAGRLDIAVKTAEQAKSLATLKSPALIPVIRRRLDEWKNVATEQSR